MSEMFIPKTIKNLVILLQVPISNVTDGFRHFFVHFNANFMCFNLAKVVQKQMLGEVET